MKESEGISKMTWKNICTFAADKILNLEFDTVKSGSVTKLVLREKYRDYEITVALQLDAKTTSYEVSATKNSNTDTLIVSNLEYGGEYVDIGELKYYIENTKVETKKKRVEKLNEEIDKGFRRQDTRAALGGETLENDIAFNEYLHRKAYRG